MGETVLMDMLMLDDISSRWRPVLFVLLVGWCRVCWRLIVQKGFCLAVPMSIDP